MNATTLELGHYVHHEGIILRHGMAFGTHHRSVDEVTSKERSSRGKTTSGAIARLGATPQRAHVEHIEPHIYTEHKCCLHDFYQHLPPAQSIAPRHAFALQKHILRVKYISTLNAGVEIVLRDLYLFLLCLYVKRFLVLNPRNSQR